MPSSDPPDLSVRATPPDVTYRAMQPEDTDAGLRLCRLSGWDQVARDWECFLAGKPPAVVAAIRGGRVIGTAATLRFGGRFGWIGMVLVDPDAQGQRLGTSLLTWALDTLRDLPAVRLDATPAGHALYQKHGFVEEYRLRRMEATGVRVVQQPYPAIQPMTPDDLSDVFAMDEHVFGAPRAPLLGWMYAGAPEYAFVARKDGRLAGYLLGRHGHQFEHLGPIVASDARTAEEMAATCLARTGGRAFIVDAACHNEPWNLFLERAGFREQRPFIRMHRGGHPPFGDPQRQFAMLGPEFG